MRIPVGQRDAFLPLHLWRLGFSSQTLILNGPGPIGMMLPSFQRLFQMCTLPFIL